MAVCLSFALATVGSSCSDSSGPGNPEAKFAFVCAALRCDFQDQSSGEIVRWNWTFGDSDTASGANGFHVYAAPGTYTVGLTVTDAEGRHSSVSHDVVTTRPVVAHLSCEDASAPGQFVQCSLELPQDAGFKVVLTSRECVAHGTTFRVTVPLTDTLTTDGCYEKIGRERTYAGPFAAGTEIDAEVIGPRRPNPPQVHVSGGYPKWTLSYEDGGDSDFNDLIITVTALPLAGLNR
jgi:PKD repeat protein